MTADALASSQEQGRFLTLDEAVEKVVEARRKTPTGGRRARLEASNTEAEEKEIRQFLTKLSGGTKGYLTESEWRKAFSTFPELLPFNNYGGNMIASLQVEDFGPQMQPVAVSIAKAKATVVSATAWIVSAIEGFISGGIAGAVAKTIIAPGDRVKIIYQVTADRVFSLRNAWKTAGRIVERGGVLGLWRGHGATLLRIVPYASASFSCFPQYEKLFKAMLLPKKSEEEETQETTRKEERAKDRRAILARFLAGASAGATATALTYPLDLIRARFAAHWSFDSHRYPSYSHAFREIRQLEGWRALYGGLGPTLIGIMPYAGLSFALFETFKANLVKHQGLTNDHDIAVWQRLCAGSVAGWIAQSATYPLDIVRRRMQVHPHKYRTIRAALTDIYKNEGLKAGLFKGVSMNWIKGPIAVATSFTVNDEVKKRIRAYHAHVASETNAAARQQLSTLELLICGGAAGGLAKLWTLPFDRLKIIYSMGLMAADEHNFAGHAVRTMKDLYWDLPAGKMWQGSGAMMMRAVPYAAITYASFGWWQGFWQRASYTQESTVATNFAAGASAASACTLLLHPLDVMRTRSAAQINKGRPFPSYWIGLKETVAQGGWKSLFMGWRAAIIGIAPMAGIAFAFYEFVKVQYNCDTFASQLVAGAAAGGCAQVCTYPLNVVRRRAQVVMEGELHGSKGVIDSLWRIASKEGFYGGLYTRMPLGWVFGTATVGLSFAINDFLKGHAISFRNTVYRESITA